MEKVKKKGIVGRELINDVGKERERETVGWAFLFMGEMIPEGSSGRV